MSLEIQAEKIKVDHSYDFEFSNNVGLNFTVGISGFHFFFDDDDDNNILNFSVQLSSQINGNTITVKPALIMNDNAGHNLSDDSWVVVTILAAIGDSTSNYLTFGNTSSISNSSSSQPITLLNNRPTALLAVLSGFNLNYESSHHIMDIDLGCGITSAGDNTRFAISSTAKMEDNSGNQAVNPTIDAGYVVCYDKGIMEIKTGDITGDTPDTIGDFDSKSKAYILFTAINFSYGSSDHQINSITLSLDYESDYSLPINNGKVNLVPALGMNDSSKHNSNVKVSYIIIDVK